MKEQKKDYFSEGRGSFACAIWLLLFWLAIIFFVLKIPIFIKICAVIIFFLAYTINIGVKIRKIYNEKKIKTVN